MPQCINTINPIICPRKNIFQLLLTVNNSRNWCRQPNTFLYKYYFNKLTSLKIWRLQNFWHMTQKLWFELSNWRLEISWSPVSRTDEQTVGQIGRETDNLVYNKNIPLNVCNQQIQQTLNMHSKWTSDNETL